jgi:hypothetical protein
VKKTSGEFEALTLPAYVELQVHPLLALRDGMRMCAIAKMASDCHLSPSLFPRIADGGDADVIAAMRRVIRWAPR